MAPILDRIPFFDERSRRYGVHALLQTSTVARRRQIWQPRPSPLDQGSEGACVAYAITGELAAQPQTYTVDNSYARELYANIQATDRAMGNNWPQGASLLAGAKTAQQRGLVASYWWAFGVEQVIDAVIQQGPVVVGIPWYQGMYSTQPGGLVRLSGPMVGGHAIMVNGYDPAHPQFGEVLIWTQSWGTGYGLNGTGYVPKGVMRQLLANQGEACVLTDVALPGPAAVADPQQAASQPPQAPPQSF
jgi:hypothetical protein